MEKLTVDYPYGKRTVEYNINRIMEHAKVGSLTLSACREEYSHKENLERTISLIKDLKKLGYGYIPLVGQYVEEDSQISEYSFLFPFPNKNKEETFDEMVTNLQVLADRYGQESILVVKEGKGVLIYGNRREEAVEGFTYPVTKNIYTSTLAMGNHRKHNWTIEGVVGYPRTLNGRLGAYKLGELE